MIRTTLPLGVVPLALLASSVGEGQSPPGGRYKQPLTLPDGWRTASADSAGVDPGRLAALTASIRPWPELGVHAILIERGGRLIYEEYFDGFDTGASR